MTNTKPEKEEVEVRDHAPSHAICASRQETFMTDKRSEAPVPQSAASTVEPVAKLDPVTDWVGARLRSAAEKAEAVAVSRQNRETS